jgi:superfamily I DNA/RNA helicase
VEAEMKNTNIIVGPPGTGKTTELLNLVDLYLSQGVDPQKIGFVSFTKKSVEEAKTRSSIKFKQDKDFFNYFRTLHSMAFYQLSMMKASVVEKSHYMEVGDLIGVPIKGKTGLEYSIDDLSIGDQLVFLESLSRMRCEDLEVTYNREVLDFEYHSLLLYKETYDKYKKVNGLYDFTDMLTRFNEHFVMPELDVLFVDEAQDLCLLQWKIIEKMSEISGITYVAGDDDQAIFRWSGADIEYFIGLAEKNPTKVLTQSYRVPKTVYEIALKLTEGIKGRVSKTYSPTKEQGFVEYVSGIDDIDFSTGEWLVLVRNLYMVREITDFLKFSGYTYLSRWKDYNAENALKAALNWEKLRKGVAISDNDKKDVLSYMTSKAVEKNKHKPWFEALDKISMEDREYFLAVRKRGGSFVTKPRITVSTIHGAKGGESENVVLFTDLSKRTYNSMTTNYDDESRVFYVGVTRAKKNLYIVQEQTNCYFSI